MSEHRGRIQSQGCKVQTSKAWTQKKPLYASIAQNKVDELEKQHQKKEMQMRKHAFKRARKFSEQAKNNGGVSHPVSQSYMVRGDSARRVDIEVKKGIAFI